MADNHHELLIGLFSAIKENRRFYDALTVLIEKERSRWWAQANGVACSEMPYFVGGCKSLDDLLAKINRELTKGESK